MMLVLSLGHVREASFRHFKFKEKDTGGFPAFFFPFLNRTVISKLNGICEFYLFAFPGNRSLTRSSVSPMDCLNRCQFSDMGFYRTAHIATASETCKDDDINSTSNLILSASQGMQWQYKNNYQV